ncbi:MAG: hypothetical protein K2G89_00220 [Lachnospiraceae bacterium]|nr:hypothetical protein [Lachnospiraceae bacterium]
MEKLKLCLAILFSMFGLITSLIMLKKEIKRIKEIKVKSSDGYIKAVVVDSASTLDLTSDVKPILQYTVGGIDKKYIYHFNCNPKQYPIGKEVKLRLSEDSGLAYDRKDLVKSLVEHLLVIMFFGLGVCACSWYLLYIS